MYVMVRYRQTFGYMVEVEVLTQLTQHYNPDSVKNIVPYTGCLESYFQVYEKSFEWPVRIVDHQVEVQLLDEEQLVL